MSSFERPHVCDAGRCPPEQYSLLLRCVYLCLVRWYRIGECSNEKYQLSVCPLHSSSGHPRHRARFLELRMALKNAFLVIFVVSTQI